jgi:WD40 repeat protein/serine/threonine protein kinase/tetratricopeptide (TPR) repeat protein
MSAPGTNSEVVLALAEEFLERHRQGERPALKEYVDRHPELAAEIRQVFPAMAMMENIALADASLDGSPEAGAAPAPVALQQLGDYRIIRQVGQGGMGVVYEAEQVSLGRHVALKVLPQKLLLDAQRKRRFEREAKAAAKLHHTNIVPVYGIGEHEGVPYYVMQFIAGLGLDEVLAELKRWQSSGRRGSAGAPTVGESPVARQDISAADMARSLLTGAFEPAPSPGDESEPGGEPPGGRTIDQPPDRGREAPPAPSTRTGRLSDSFSPSSSSLVLPGSSEASSPRRARKLTYWQSVAHLGVQVAGALQHAHEQGILHRDIKPSNLLLDRRGTVWVTDFGLAKADDRQNLTHAGDILGTLRYMPPEAFEGRNDPRSDVYSLGLTLYELLAFQPAFRERDRRKLIKEVLNEEPPRLDRLKAEIPRDLVTIIHKAIDREPGRRYQAARELAEDLERFLADEPIRARRIGVRERLWRWCRHKPAVAALTAALAVVLVAVTVGAMITALWYLRVAQDTEQARQNEEAARQKAEQAHQDEEAAREKAEWTLTDMYTSQGLSAAERPDPAQAVLWFANAARLAGAGTEREEANRARVTTWSRQAPQPVRALPHSTPWVKRLAFHPGGQYLLTQTFTDKGEDGDCTVWDLIQEVPVTLPGKIGSASSAAWSPDGQWLALGTPQGEVFLCRFPSGEVHRRLLHGGQINALAFSPDGRFLAIARAYPRWGTSRSLPARQAVGIAFASPNVVSPSLPGILLATLVGRSPTVRVWDCQAGDFVTPVLKHSAPVTNLTFHPQSHRLVTSCWDGRARVFAIPNGTGEPLFPPLSQFQGSNPAHGNQPFATTFIDEGRGLLTHAPKLVWRNAETGAILRQVSFPAEITASYIYGVVVSPDGKYFAVLGRGGAQIWEVRTGRAVSPLLANREQQYSVWGAFSPDGRTLLTACSDNTLRRWAVPGGQALGRPIAHPTPVHGVAYSPDGRFFATAQRGGLVRLWASPMDSARNQTLPLEGYGSRVKLSRDGRYALPTGTNQNRCTLPATRVYEVATGQPAGPLLEAGGIILDAAFSPDERQVALLVAVGDATVRVSNSSKIVGLVKFWDWRTGQPLGSPLPLPSEPRGLDYSSDGQHCAVICAGGQLVVIHPAKGQITRQWRAQAPHLMSANPVNGMLRFSPDGQSILTYSTDTVVRVWEAATGKERYAALEHQEPCRDVQFSAAGRLLATAALDHSVRLWDLATGRQVAEPLPHPDRAYAAAFSPDGNYVLTGCRDNMARLWDWRTGRLVCPAFEHEHEVHGVAFHPGGRWVLTASDDQTLRVWDWRTGKPVTPALATGGVGKCVAVTPDGNFAVVGGLLNALPVFYLGDLSARAELDLDDLCTWGEVLSGQRVEGSGVTNLPADHWLQRWRGFRQRHPSHGRLDPGETLAWSRGEAATCEKDKQWSAAIWHLDRLLAAQPDQEHLHRRRGQAYAELGQWDQAAADFAKAIGLKQLDIETWFQHALLRLAVGDHAGYRSACGGMLERFGPTADRQISIKLAAACLLAPEAVTQYGGLVRALELAVAARPNVCVHYHSLGGMLYRAGRFAEAVPPLKEAIRLHSREGVVSDWLFLAMAYHRLGQADEARPWLHKAVEELDRRQQAKGTSDAASAWNLRPEQLLLLDQLLRREAEALIDGLKAEPGK